MFNLSSSSGIMFFDQKGHRPMDKHTDITTYRLNWPRGRCSEIYLLENKNAKKADSKVRDFQIPNKMQQNSKKTWPPEPYIHSESHILASVATS